MRNPRKEELYNPILGYLKYKGTSTVLDIYSAMAQYFYIPLNKGLERVTSDAISHLYHAGFIDRIYRGKYSLLEAGERAVDNDDTVTDNYLRCFPSYRSFEQWKAEGGRKNKDNPDHYPSYDEVVVPRSAAKPEYIHIPNVSIDNLVELCEKDTRFANMIESGHYILDEGKIAEVPIEVIQHDMTYVEYKEETLCHSATREAICCMATVDGNGQQIIVKAETTTERAAHHNRTYTVIGGGNTSYVPPSNYTNYAPTIDEFNRANDINTYSKGATRFIDVMSYIIKTHYAPRGADKDTISQKTGISSRTIQRMMNGDSGKGNNGQTVDYHPCEKFILAVSLVLGLDVTTVEYLFDLAGHSTNSYDNKKYMLIYSMSKFCTYEQVNNFCVQAGVDEIFDANLTGLIEKF